MLEDSKMDKKINNRSSQTQSHASGVDCRKSSELTHRPTSRYNKKREGPSASKNDPINRNVPVQRGRGQVDRRAKPRGSTSSDLGGAENTWIAEGEPELGSVLKRGSKKQNITSLTNFSSGYNGGRQRRAPEPRRTMQQRSKVIHPHNNDLYLQAFCQFVVKKDGDYEVNLVDPDVPIKWEQIEEIIVRSAGKSECPICLFPPVSARVGRCGHVHCWPCALHLAAAAALPAPPCPVCAAPLQVHLMKPARVVQWDGPGELVTMRLVRRLRGTAGVEPAPERGQGAESPPPPPSAVLPLEGNEGAPFAKLFYVDQPQVLDIIKRHRKELQDQILNEIDTTEIVFIEQALEMLQAQEQMLNTPEIPKVVEDIKKYDAPTVFEKPSIIDKKIDWFDEEEGAACLEAIQSQCNNLSLNTPETSIKTELNPNAPVFEIDGRLDEALEFSLVEDSVPTVLEEQTEINEVDLENKSKYFYFYQAEDGQAVFLHRLNVRLLADSWGLLAAAPRRLTARVLHRETISLDLQSRKRLPYAAHLPLHSPFDIVELDLQPPTVTLEAIDKHAEALRTRARARSRLAREEKLLERACRPSPRASRPCFTPDDFPLPLCPAPEPASPDTYPELPSSSVDTSVASSSSGLSFAKMASASGTWRVRPSVVRAPSPSPPPAETEDVASPRLLSLADAFSAAINAPKQKKEKKKGKKVLLPMGMQRPAD